jgi:hypothetical protein
VLLRLAIKNTALASIICATSVVLSFITMLWSLV